MRLVLVTSGLLGLLTQIVGAAEPDRLTLDEIAVELKITRAGVKKQLYAATAFVRQYLQEHGEITALLFVFLSLFEQ